MAKPLLSVNLKTMIQNIKMTSSKQPTAEIDGNALRFCIVSKRGLAEFTANSRLLETSEGQRIVKHVIWGLG